MNNVTKDLLEALKACRDRFAFYVEHHQAKGDRAKAAENEMFVAMADNAITGAICARPSAAEPVNARLLGVATGKISHIFAGICPDAISGSNSRDPECPACRAIAAAESQAGPVRLTDAEIDVMQAQHNADFHAGIVVNHRSFFRVIETAVLRKNGIEVAE